MFWQTAASEQQSESDEEWERKQTGGVCRRAELQGVDAKTATPVKHRAIKCSSSGGAAVQSGCVSLLFLLRWRWRRGVWQSIFIWRCWTQQASWWQSCLCRGCCAGLHHTVQVFFPINSQQPALVIMTDVRVSGEFRNNMICQDVRPWGSPKINTLQNMKTHWTQHGRLGK